MILTISVHTCNDLLNTTPIILIHPSIGIPFEKTKQKPPTHHTDDALIKTWD